MPNWTGRRTDRRTDYIGAEDALSVSPTHPEPLRTLAAAFFCRGGLSVDVLRPLGKAWTDAVEPGKDHDLV